MSSIKVIKSEREHTQAMSRLMALMDADPKEGSAEANELEVLALLIGQYEAENFPIDPPDPIEAIKLRMDQAGLKKKDLVPFIGSPSKVSEVLSGKRPLSLNMIRKLSQGLGLSADLLIREPLQRQVDAKDIDWQAFPVAEMRKRGYFDGSPESVAEIKEYAPEYMGRFFAPVDGLSLRPALLRTTAHLRTSKKETDSYALMAWQARVLHLAKSEPLAVAYQGGVVTKEWMRQLAKFSWSDKGPLLAKEYLGQAGIHLVFERHLPKTYLDGAVCISNSGNPLVALTLRYDRLDNFWFTLMHELAHIALHLDGNETWYIDDLDAEGSNKAEREADALAKESLIPGKVWKQNPVATAEDVVNLARQLSISPCIVAGRVRHEQGDHKLFGRQFREKVRNLVGPPKY